MKWSSESVKGGTHTKNGRKNERNLKKALKLKRRKCGKYLVISVLDQEKN